MDLITIGQTVRRHKFATLPILVLMLVLGFYVLKVATPDYEAAGSYILVNPPAPPTDSQIARDPALAKVDTYNPFTSYGSLSVVGLMVTQALTTPPAQQALLAHGMDPRSTFTNNTTYGNAPLVSITGVGSTAAGAVRSGVLIGQALVEELNTMQASEHVNPTYRITAFPLVVPAQASLKLSSKLRELIGVIAGGVILLFVSVSIASAREERRKVRSAGLPARHLTNGVPPADQADAALVASTNGSASG